MSDNFKSYKCVICGFIYEEEKGIPKGEGDGDEGKGEKWFPPGTRWEDIPEDWLCPDCAVGKSDFELIDE